MIDPNNIINFNRTDSELEELLLFLVCVAGKKASTVSRQLNEFLNVSMTISPFTLIKVWKAENLLRHNLEKAKFGQYNKIERAFTELANSDFNLRTCTKEDLMSIHGIGRKSASCFLAWTRKREKVAMLDTHLLKWLRASHPESPVNIPKSTPSSVKLYDTLEKMYLDFCEVRHIDPTEFDLEIWRYYSQGLDKKKQ